MKILLEPQREPTTTITVSMQTAETIRKLVGTMQSHSGMTVTQRMVVDAALEIYMKNIKEDERDGI